MSGNDSLELEKINAQRITNVEQDIKEVRKDVAQLMRELPHIVQDAVSQALGAVKGDNGRSKSENGSKTVWSIGIIITLIFSVGGMLQQQIVFLSDIVNNNRAKIEKQSEMYEEDKKWMLSYFDKLVEKTEKYYEKELDHVKQRLEKAEERKTV